MNASLASGENQLAEGESVLFSPSIPEISLPPQSDPERKPSVPFPERPDNAPPRKSKRSPRESARHITTTLLMGDWFFAAFAIFTALTLRELQVGPRPDGAADLYSHITLWTLGASTLFLWIMLLFRTYEARSIFRIQHFFRNLFRSVFIWSTVIWAAFGLFPIEGFTPRVGAVYCMITLVGFVGVWRLFAYSILTSRQMNRAISSRILIIGWNKKAQHLSDALGVDFAQLGYVVGCIPGPNGLLCAEPPDDVEVLGKYTELADLLKEHRIHSVVLADLDCSAVDIQQLISFCQRELVSFQLIPDYFPALISGLQVNTINGIPLLGINELPLDRTINRVCKRMIDIVGASIGIAISALIIPWFCALVFIESPGAVIYRQLRMSRSGHLFFIYKIRSMRLDAESTSGAVWCKKEDPRRLRIGEFMRKWNIDELPQFINVLKGEMSLVGPRPERPELIDRFKKEIPNYNVRHEVRSGLTGWAQIQGLRGDTDLSKRIEADLYYLENWSIFLDAYCMIATCFKTKNAH